MTFLQIVLLGQIGSGKTTLYNRITNSQENGRNFGSLTSNVLLKESAFGKVPFKVLYTPGFGARFNKIDHLAGIMAALAEGPINRIILVVKLERLDIMVKALRSIITPFRRFRNLITILVTHWDNLEIQEQANNMKQIKDRFEKFNIKSFIFSSKDDNGAYTCDQIIREVNRQPKLVDLFEPDQKFDLAEFTEDLEFDIEEQDIKLLAQFRKKTKAIRYFIEKFPLTKLIKSSVRQKFYTKITKRNQKIQNFNYQKKNTIIK